MKKALILTGKFATDREVYYPIYRLDEAGFKVDIATRGEETVLGIVGEKIVPTRDVPHVNFAQPTPDYDLLVLPGGAKAMEYMRQDREILDYIQWHHRVGGVIASICHAAQLLISARLVNGRQISGYYSIRDDIENAGGIYVDAPAVVDDRIVSTAHYKHMGPWMAAALREVIRREAAAMNMEDAVK
jgi:protease I